MTDNALECGLESRPEIADEDQALVRRAGSDTEAAGRLYDKYCREVSNYIYHCTLDAALTDDLTANVFLAAFTHLGGFRWRHIPFQAWLCRIATNEVRTHYRRRKPVTVVELGPEHEALPGPAPSGDENAEAAEEYRLVHEALMELPPAYRTAIVLRYFENKTIHDIATITGHREGTIKSQLHRGLIRLQEALVRRGVLRE